MSVRRNNTQFLQKCLDLRLTSAERQIQFVFITCAAPGQNTFTEGICRLPAEYALFLEQGESIGFQDLSPFVRIVSGRVCSVEEMV